MAEGECARFVHSFFKVGINKEENMSKLKELEKLLSHGKITRREFLARASALGLAVVVSPAMLPA